MLIEVSGSEESVSERLQTFMGRKLNLENDSVLIASNKSQEREMWAMREQVPTCLMDLSRQHGGRLYKYDLSLTMPQMHEVVSALQDRLNEEKSYKFPSLNIEVCNFGHCGDLNLHLNILARPRASHERTHGDLESLPSQLDALQGVLDECIAKEVTARRGSLSAEHGVGQLKKKYMTLARSEEEVSLMRAIKKVFDPAGILNPTTMLDVQSV